MLTVLPARILVQARRVVYRVEMGIMALRLSLIGLLAAFVHATCQQPLSSSLTFVIV